MSIFSVYMISNDVNNKVYIGQTTKSIHKRFQEHCLHHSSAIGQAIDEIGKEHFSVSLVDDTSKNLEELSEKEEFYIKKYNAIENGYNSRLACKTNGRISKQRIPSPIDKELYNKLKAYSEETDIPMSKLLDRAIRMFLESIERDK